MEDFGANWQGALSASLSQVDRCDAMVLIVGTCYGRRPQGHDLSYTHHEYRRARERGQAFLAFVIEGEDGPEDGPELRDFRDEVLRSVTVAKAHSDPAHVPSEVVGAVGHLAQVRATAAASSRARRRFLGLGSVVAVLVAAVSWFTRTEPLSVHVTKPENDEHTNAATIEVVGEVLQGPSGSIRIGKRDVEVVDGKLTTRVDLETGRNAIVIPGASPLSVVRDDQPPTIDAIAKRVVGDRLFDPRASASFVENTQERRSARELARSGWASLGFTMASSRHRPSTTMAYVAFPLIGQR